MQQGMTMTDSTSHGCGSASCACSGQMQIVPASINGIALHEPGQALDGDTLRERAYGELLRQRAVHKGLLPRTPVLVAPELDAAERHVIEAMTDDEVCSPEPTDDEANASKCLAATREAIDALVAGLDLAPFATTPMLVATVVLPR